ncbi:hemerythrin domain-containing protein [Streptomyces sp. NRRL S-118]|uniref:hemerythrin domain-containing protein n=1 Tax=Streptomyces sp. NRRL S-118 TaxID=1463881 RepID=UPI0006944A26|nr:hemerythrin domain-containing protein [Streptomyces sp. NRRL S-118]
MPGEGDPQDVVAFLTEQHARIRRLFDDVAGSRGPERAERFGELVRLLAAHEAAEEEIVHPFARGRIDGGEPVVEQRLEEEQAARRAVGALEDLDTGTPAFLERLARLRQDVLAHAEAEERYEFTHLRVAAGRAQLENLAKAVKAVQAAAPARPHPGTAPAAVRDGRS